MTASPRHFFALVVSATFLTAVHGGVYNTVRKTLPWNTPPCLTTKTALPHSWQKLFLTPDEYRAFPPGNFCQIVRFHSNHLKLNQIRQLFPKHKVCLFDKNLVTHVDFQIRCFPKSNNLLYRFQKDLILTHPISQKIATSDVRLAHTMLDDRRTNRSKMKRSLSKGIHFEKTKYRINVTEELAEEVKLLSLKAVNLDRFPMYYSMIAPEDSRSSEYFRLNRTTGELTTTSTQKFDRETMAKHFLKISAYEVGNPTRSATASVIVDVLDVNDHVPIFEQQTFFESISETAAIGTTVGTVHARDDDFGPNGKVRYSFNEKEAMGKFRIDPDTGIVQVKDTLDREERDLYRITVWASDNGSPLKRNTSALIEITLKDANDNHPQFTQSKYQVSIPENMDPGTNPLVAKVRAIDADAEENGQVRYSIVSGNHGDTFTIDYATGEIRLEKALNLKSHPIYELLIRAQDSGQSFLSNTTILRVNIEDVNDHSPKFYISLYEKNVKEDVPKHTQVVHVQAMDGDYGENAAVKYALKNVESEDDFPFQIDPLDGRIFTKKELDREIHQKFEFEVVAVDSGTPPLSSSTRVLIHVQDVNDNSPTFGKREYNISVREDSQRGSKLLEIGAIDRDQSSKITYSIVNGNPEDTFTLITERDDRAVLRLNGELDFKQHYIYTLTVKATDGNKYDTATIYVYVLDVNSAPFFIQQPFAVKIAENEPVGATVAVVQAMDNDEGDNAQIAYSLVDSDANNPFIIDPETGVIRIGRGLDREVTPNYNLYIQVKDNGQPPLAEKTHLEIFLLDVNDNAPAFQELNYTKSIPEDTPVGNSFLQVTATDPDFDSNSIITYFFSRETAAAINDTFRIDETSGTIRVQEPIDRERVPFYELEVLAIDRGVLPKTGTTTVLIVLEDINDNPPEFQRDVYHLYISENKPVGSLVGKIIADDKDSGTNAETTYRISSGINMADFELQTPADGEKGVEVYSRIPLDYESTHIIYEFKLMASSGERRSTVEVIVHVQDDNDNLPELKDFFIVFYNYPDYFPTRPLGRIPAFDPDVNDTLRYVITEGNDAQLIIVDEDTGQLSLSPTLNTNRDIDALLTVCVSDGTNKVCVKCTLEVVLVTEAMLLHSVTLTARGRSREELLSPVPFSRMVDALSTLLPSDRNDVILFSVQESPPSPTFDTPHIPLVNISFAIRKPFSNNFVSAEELREVVYLNRMGLSAVANVEILPFEDNICVREPCVNFGVCENVLRFGAAPDFITTDDFLFRPVDPISTFKCTCPSGFAGRDKQLLCDTEVNLCYSSPCGHNGTCVQKENGYICLCPPNRTGAKCEFPLITNFCLPGICSGWSQCDASSGQITCKHCKLDPEFSTPFCELRARSFDGDSHVTFPPLKHRYRFHLQLSVATIKSEGLILYNGRYQAKEDFFALKLRNGIPEISFSLGGDKITTLTLPVTETNKINDGEWHTIRIQYFQKRMTMSIDDCNEELSLRFASQIDYNQCAAQITHDLEQKCDNPTVSCYRFLDLTGPLYLGGAPSKTLTRLGPLDPLNYEGCVRDLKVDDKMMDLVRVITNRGSEMGCSAMKERCLDRPCSNRDECINIWNGYKCECPEEKTGRTCSDGVYPHQGEAMELESVDSYVLWQIEKHALPLSLGLSFRTRQRTAMPLALEYNDRQPHYALSFRIKEGRPSVVLGAEEWETDFPVVSDGDWHHFSLSVHTHSINITSDYTYSQSFETEGKTYYKSAISAFVGSLSSDKTVTNPSPFIGCVKGAYVLNKHGERVYLRTLRHYGTREGCRPLSPCQSRTVCPTNSNCVADWDTYKCECHLGYYGSKCLDVCDIKGLCRNGGRCVRSFGREGSYRCECGEGWRGDHCEEGVEEGERGCPAGWWGSPLCGPCNCPVDKGFNPDCDKSTGQCYCKNNHYKPKGSESCFPCNCYYPTGANRTACHPTSGQCSCKGSAIGRKCERCADPRAQIKGNYGVCEVVTNACPSSIDAHIHWPKTQFGMSVKKDCPYHSHGTATRHCEEDTLWTQPNLSNCTSISFDRLARTLSQLDANHLFLTNYLARVVAKDLRNSTKSPLVQGMQGKLYEQDVYVGYRLLLALLRHELNQYSTNSVTHIQDKFFVEDIVWSASRLLDSENMNSMEEITRQDSTTVAYFLSTMDQYGSLLARIHQKAFLRPFQVVSENLVFAVDIVKARTSSRVFFPKYDNFLPQPGVFNSEYPISFQLSLDSNLKGELLSGEEWEVGSPVVSVGLGVGEGEGGSLGMERGFIDLVLPLQLHTNRSNPVCSWWNTETQEWSGSGCFLRYQNSTHAICSCDHLSSFAVLTQIVPEFSVISDNLLRYLAPSCGGLGLTILMITIVVVCCLRGTEGGSRCRGIQLALTLSLLFNILSFIFVNWARSPQIVCYMVGTILSFSTISLHAWLFVWSLHFYRTITELRDVNLGSFWPYGVVGWVLPAVVAVITVCIHRSSFGGLHFCWFWIRDAYIWTMIAPTLLFLLLSLYLNVMCCIVACNKDWDLMFAKMKLRSCLSFNFLLLLLGIFFSAIQLGSINQQNLVLHYTYLVTLLAFSLLVLVWVAYWDQNYTHSQSNWKKTVNLWLNDENVSSKHNGEVVGVRESREEEVGEGEGEGEGRAESPFLNEDLAPRDDDAHSPHFHHDPLFNDSRFAQSNAGLCSVPLSRGNYRKPCGGSSDEEASRPFLSHLDSPDFKKFSKPDLIPTWDERLDSASAATTPNSLPPTHIPYTSPYRNYAGIYRSTAYMTPSSGVGSSGGYSSRASTSSARNPILSPVQKVLYGNSTTDDTVLDQSTGSRTHLVSSGFQTFSPRSTNRRTFETFSTRTTATFEAPEGSNRGSFGNGSSLGTPTPGTSSGGSETAL